MNFPFQSSDGIQTSILMSESAVGLSSAATRQKAGNRLNWACCGGGAEGAVNVPASTVSARVIAVSGRASLARLAHVSAKMAGAVAAAARRAMKWIDTSPPADQYITVQLTPDRFPRHNA